jgi:hypothetical protein
MQLSVFSLAIALFSARRHRAFAFTQTPVTNFSSLDRLYRHTEPDFAEARNVW